jgi:hypothetical protein
MNSSLPLTALAKDDLDYGRAAVDGSGTSAGFHTFPMKLMEVLAMEEFNPIAQWTPRGRSFRVIDPDRFENEVLAVHFKRAKFSSFLRKLRRWGFNRVCRGPDAGKSLPLLFVCVFKQRSQSKFYNLQARSFTETSSVITPMPFLTCCVRGENRQLNPRART